MLNRYEWLVVKKAAGPLSAREERELEALAKAGAS